MIEYSSEHLDIIKEISNIALGNAATSLSELFKVNISMNVPSINLETIESFMSNQKDIEVIGQILMVKGDIEGSILILFDIDTAKKIVNKVANGAVKSQEELDDIRVSFIEEVCNIVGSTYIRNIADCLNINLEIESNSLLYDNLMAILSYTFMEEEQFYDNIVNIETDFRYELYSEIREVFFYFVPRKGNLVKIINKLR